jgi:hypothetical protein
VRSSLGKGEKIEKSGTGAPVALMCEIPHRDFERGARLPLKLKNWFEQPKGDTTMFPLFRNSLKMAAASAIVALPAFAAPVNAYERVQKLGPVVAFEPILTTIGNKNVVAFFSPGNGQCNVQAVFWNADDMAAKSAGGVRISLEPAQTVSIDSSPTETLTFKCGDYAESLSALDSEQQLAAK